MTRRLRDLSVEELKRLHHALELPGPTDTLSLLLQGLVLLAIGHAGPKGREVSWLDWVCIAGGVLILALTASRFFRDRTNARERAECVAMLDAADPPDPNVN